MNIVSSSFGKDSTAMIHLMLENDIRIDEVMYFDTGWDFPQMEAHIARVEENTGIKVVRLRYYREFDELLSRWGWPDKSGGWCAGRKASTCDKFFRGVKGSVEFIGFTTDELHRCNRLKKKWPVRFPLVEYGFSEKDALNYCLSLGYDWGGLYDIFSRVSCFCCPKAGQKRIDKLKYHFPDLHKQYLKMDDIAKGKKSSDRKPIIKTDFKPEKQLSLFPNFKEAV